MLTQAGVQPQGLAALTKAFNQSVKITEPRSRRQSVLKAFKRVLTEAMSEHEKNSRSGVCRGTDTAKAAKDAAATGGKKGQSKHEETATGRPASQRMVEPKQQSLPTKWLVLKKNTTCAQDVDCRSAGT